MDTEHDDELAHLSARHICLSRERAAAAAALSASVFNRPQMHDTVHSSVPFQRLRTLEERLRQLEDGMLRLGGARAT